MSRSTLSTVNAYLIRYTNTPRPLSSDRVASYINTTLRSTVQFEQIGRHTIMDQVRSSVGAKSQTMRLHWDSSAESQFVRVLISCANKELHLKPLGASQRVIGSCLHPPEPNGVIMSVSGSGPKRLGGSHRGTLCYLTMVGCVIGVIYWMPSLITFNFGPSFSSPRFCNGGPFFLLHLPFPLSFLCTSQCTGTSFVIRCTT